jgi:hypothetical protein
MRWFLRDAAIFTGMVAVGFWLLEPGWLGGAGIVALCAWCWWQHWRDERQFRD